jgi:hypothetical protein
MNRVDEFLAKAKPRRTGGQCRTCQHPKHTEIDKDCDRFVVRRSEGSAVSWHYFTTKHLRAEYGYEHDFRSLINHMEKCRGLKVN